MKDYGDLVFVEDAEGRLYTCPSDAIRNIDKISDNEKEQCHDVTHLFGK